MFGKGLRPLSPVERLEQVDRQSIVLKSLPADVPNTVSGAFMDGTLQAEAYCGLAEALAADGQAPKSFAELRETLGKCNVTPFQIAEAVVSVPRLQQCFLLSMARGRSDAKEAASDVWEMLSALGQSLLKDGKTLEGRDAHVEELARQAGEFISSRLPLLRNLGVSLG